MKKKNNIRQLREQKQTGTKAKYSQMALEAQKKAEAEAEQERMRAARLETERLCQSMKQQLHLGGDKRVSCFTRPKSRVKANGLKSMFILGDELLLTSFGRGNEALEEASVVNDRLTPLNTEPVFDADLKPRYIEIRRRVKIDAEPGQATRFKVPSDTLPTDVHQDLIRAKSVLEQTYFGAEQPDNLHIQLIYNVLDIEKQLAVYVDHIIYAINNVAALKTSDEFNVDTIGDLNLTYRLFENSQKPLPSKGAWFNEFCASPRLLYFGNAFYHVTSTKKGAPSEKLREPADIAAMLELIGGLRQYLKHGQARNKAWLYRLDRNMKENHRHVLDMLYTEKVSSINKDFLKQSSKDLTVAFKALGAADIAACQRVTDVYYRHVVLKDARNIGFSVKTLREMLVFIHLPELRDKQFDSVRSKYNRMFDFILFWHYSVTAPKEADGFVDRLRGNMVDADKNLLYADEVKRVWPNVGAAFSAVQRCYGTGGEVKDIQPKKEIMDALSLEAVQISAENTTSFSKLMYMLTLFLDGKEINDLLTTLLSKLENIGSLAGIIHNRGLTDLGGTDYALLEQANHLADELRVVKSFARMEGPAEGAKPFMLVDAGKLLGQPVSEEVFRLVYGETYAKYHRLDDEQLRAIFEKEHPGERFARKAFFKNDTSLRNFMIRNVVESARFRYIIRYANAENIREFAKNAPLVRFVLGRMPEKQIERYYAACNPDCPKGSPDEQIEALQRLIGTLNFEQFRDVPQKVKDSSRSAELNIKVKYQAIIGLYLTVLYLITKNLTNINARYTIAFHCWERDTELLTDYKQSLFGRSNTDYAAIYALTEREMAHILQKKADGKRYNGHALSYIDKNRRVLTDDEGAFHLFRLYRNAVAHLDAVTNAYRFASELKQVDSYFAVYHYTMQRYIMEHGGYQEKQIALRCPRVAEMAADIKKYRQYSKDWLWAVNNPFAYNLPRYKNLSCKELFDKNEPPMQTDAAEDDEA